MRLVPELTLLCHTKHCGVVFFSRVAERQGGPSWETCRSTLDLKKKKWYRWKKITVLQWKQLSLSPKVTKCREKVSKLATLTARRFRPPSKTTPPKLPLLMQIYHNEREQQKWLLLVLTAVQLAACGKTHNECARTRRQTGSLLHHHRLNEYLIYWPLSGCNVNFN